MNRPDKAECKVRVIFLNQDIDLDDYNEGLSLGQELYAYDKSITGSISVLIPTELEPDRESALFKGEYEILEYFVK